MLTSTCSVQNFLNREPAEVYPVDGFLSLEEISQFSISYTEFGHFISGDISSKYVIENLTFKTIKCFITAWSYVLIHISSITLCSCMPFVTILTGFVFQHVSQKSMYYWLDPMCLLDRSQNILHSFLVGISHINELSGWWLYEQDVQPLDALWCYMNVLLSHSRSLKLVPLETSSTVSYLPSVVIMALSCIISEIKQDIGRKLRFLHTPALMPPLGGPPSEYYHTIWLDKLEWCGYPRWHLTDGQTNRPRTDRHTDIL